MKILMITNSLWNINNYRLELIKELIKNNHQITVVCPNDHDVSLIKNLRCNYLEIKLYDNSLNIFKNFYFLINIFNKLKKQKYDYALTYTTKINLLLPIILYFLKIKTLINVTGLGRIFNKNNLLKLFAKNIYMLNFKISYSVVFQSHIDQKYFFNNDIPIHNSNNFIVPGSGTQIKDIKLRPSNIKFVFVSRLLLRKGILDFLKISEAIKKDYPHTEFIIAGKLGNDNDYISKKILNKYIDDKLVNYLGFIEDVDSLFKESDCIIYPSTYYEGIPHALIQAASYANIIITYNWRGCAEVVENEKNGYLVDLNDHKFQNLLNTVYKVIKKDENGIIAMKKKSYELAKSKFDNAIIHSKIIDILK